MKDENLLGEIKRKEDALALLIEKTKEEARRIVEEARNRARDIEASALEEGKSEAERMGTEEMEAVEREVDAVRGEARAQAEESARAASLKFDSVVEAVLDTILPKVENDSKDE